MIVRRRGSVLPVFLLPYGTPPRTLPNTKPRAAAHPAPLGAAQAEGGGGAAGCAWGVDAAGVRLPVSAAGALPRVALGAPGAAPGGRGSGLQQHRRQPSRYCTVPNSMMCCEQCCWGFRTAIQLCSTAPQYSLSYSMPTCACSVCTSVYEHLVYFLCAHKSGYMCVYTICVYRALLEMRTVRALCRLGSLGGRAGGQGAASAWKVRAGQLGAAGARQPARRKRRGGGGSVSLSQGNQRGRG